MRSYRIKELKITDEAVDASDGNDWYRDDDVPKGDNLALHKAGIRSISHPLLPPSLILSLGRWGYDSHCPTKSENVYWSSQIFFVSGPKHALCIGTQQIKSRPRTSLHLAAVS